MKIYIIYCIALMEMLVFRLLARMTCLPNFEILNRPAYTATSICNAENLCISASAYCAENPGVLALWFDPDEAVVSKFVRPPPFTNAQDVFISKFHELVIVYKGVFNNSSWRKYRDAFLPVGPTVRRVSGYLIGIWKNKPSGNDGCQ